MRVCEYFARVCLAVSALCVTSFSALADQLDQPCSLRLSGGWIVDGSGSPGYLGDVLLDDERILLAVDRADKGAVQLSKRIYCDSSIDVSGLVVAPGFINMLSWASATLLVDPRALSDVMQGVTCLLYTSPSPRDATLSRMPSSA